ncbi:hypothetical protein TRAPUB_12954 [Trametes pubescens]|uniref:WKF domain-containing protein n=1 Tax=Trametes pubescens TaxID=154538 RepID=A0A1M2VSG5_TRAPU|nr:hypothetical protein TRAPUB_12954 [Trametes pubescens]
MAADTPEKSARKHKKAKAQEDAPPADEVVETRLEKPRKSKKTRTDTPAEGDSQETADTRAAVSTAEDNTAPKKDKKSKKRKHAEAEAKLAEGDGEKPEKKKKREQVDAPVLEDVEQSPAAESKSSKKSKSKKRKTEESEEATNAGEAVAGDSDGDPAAQSEARPRKREKRDKKRVKNPARDAQVGEDAASSSKPQKKRKHCSASGFLDPTGDEALSEQAQKALDYAFTQFEEPDSWKFNKARQNWIIRNVWSEEAIPDAYLPLASKYLQGVQGGAREALLKSCQEAIDAPQPTAEPVVEESKAVPAESESTQDSPTKRTVKFEVPVAPSSSTTANDTKRKRAADLLAILKSNATP